MLSALLRFCWIGCCAAAMLLQTLVLLDKPLEGQALLLGFVFGATLFGYYFTSRERWQRGLAYLTGGGALWCLAWLPRSMVLQVSVPGIVWALYYFAGARSLRRLRWLKPVSIAFAWAWVTVWLPLDTHEWSAAILIFAGRAAFLFALALACDLMDVHDDRQEKLLTLAQHFGEQNTFRWINKALIAAGLVCILNYFCKIYSLWAMIALLLSLGCSAGWLRFIRNHHYWEHRQKFWIDALMMLQFMTVLGVEVLTSLKWR